MEAIAAVGLASSIITFIDFGYKTVTGAVQAYKSAERISDERAHVEQSLDRLDALYADLSKPYSMSSASAPVGSELELIRIAAECASVAMQLRAALEKLTAKPHSVTYTVTKSLKTVFDKDAKRFKKRLDQLNDDFQRYMSAVLLDRHSRLSQFLVKLAHDHQQLHLDGQRQVNSIHRDLIDLVQRSQSSSEDRLLGLEDICQAMQRMLVDGQQLNAQHRVLESLYFDGMRSRRYNIHEAHEGTFRWIFDSQHAGQDVGYSEWLRTGSGAYWITGKPGAGKSTLVKFIYQHDITLELLKAWSGEHQLVTGSFYFWSTGTKMGQSLEGLLRSMIFEIIHQCPEMISCVSQNREQDSNWTTTSLPLRESYWSQGELLKILTAIASEGIPARRFCFFIDGMDEFEGSDLDVSQLLSRFAAWPNFKLCLASRPHNTFEAFFGENTASILRLHEHTRKDIRRYSADLLDLTDSTEDESDSVEELGNSDNELIDDNADENDPPSQDSTPPVMSRNSAHSFQFTGKKSSQLLDTVEERAEGVFLWVFLVIKRLQKSVYNGDSFAEVEKLITGFPQDLTNYFNIMLDSIERDYWQSSAEALLMCIALWSQPLPIVAFQSMNPLPESLTYSTLGRWKEETTKKIKSRCTDFLDVVPGNNLIVKPMPAVQFAHRTMLDFFLEQETFNKLRSRVDVDFDPSFTAYKHLTYRLPDLAKVDGLDGARPIEIWKILVDSNWKGEKLYQLFDEAHALVENARDYVDYSPWPSIRFLQLHDINDIVKDYFEHVARHDHPGFFNRRFRDFGGEELHPLQAACRYPLIMQDSEVLDVLLKYGADPNEQLILSSGTVWSTLFDIITNDKIRFRHERRDDEYVQRLIDMICSMINAGADLDCSFTYEPFKRERTNDWTFEALMDDLLLPENAARIKRFAQEKRQERAREQMSKRAQWSGWE